MKKLILGILIFSGVIFSQTFAFSDVTEDHWAYNQISELYRSAIVSGFDDGTFKPNEPLTREQSAAIMTNFFGISKKEELKTFEDVPSGYWSEKYNQFVGQFMPVTEENGKYYFRPFDNVTRVEIAETVVKIVGFDDGKVNEEIINNFSDKDTFSENDKKYISLAAENKIMVGDGNTQFRPNDTITRAEFCAMIYNVYLIRDELKEQNANKPVITVNGEVISYSDFKFHLTLQKMMYEATFGSVDLFGQEINGITLYEMMKEITKDNIISNKVKIQKANELGIKVDEETINKINEYVYTETGAQICESYGITETQLYNINYDDALLTLLSKEIYKTLDHTNHRHYDINEPIDVIVYNPRHILLVTQGLTEEKEIDAVKARAEELLERVKNGEDFATLANQYSEDGGSNLNGGLYENVLLNDFVPEFEEAALSLNDGEIYPELVVSDYGYHIIKLESKGTIKQELTDMEKQNIMDADLKEVSEEWLNNAIIEINEELYKTI